MTPFEFGQFVKQAIDYADVNARRAQAISRASKPGYYEGGVRTRTSSGATVPLNSTQQQQVNDARAQASVFNQLGASKGGLGRANIGAPSTAPTQSTSRPFGANQGGVNKFFNGRSPVQSGSTP